LEEILDISSVKGGRDSQRYNQGTTSSIMKTVAATEAQKRLGAILDDAQREPVVIRRQDRDVAVFLSMAEYERLTTGNVRAFLDLRNAIAAEAAARGLNDERVAEILSGDEA
jgi:PHD/YefM family antitoxin component YafN of YafNO toxin-antitoxin module